METTIVYWGYSGIMENEMETTIMLGLPQLEFDTYSQRSSSLTFQDLEAFIAIKTSVWWLLLLLLLPIMVLLFPRFVFPCCRSFVMQLELRL